MLSLGIDLFKYENTELSTMDDIFYLFLYPSVQRRSYYFTLFFLSIEYLQFGRELSIIFLNTLSYLASWALLFLYL